jgi:ligand-binding sensor domain-containing protein
MRVFLGLPSLLVLALMAAGAAPYPDITWTHYDSEQGLPSDKVMSVAVDGAAVWAGTEGGLARLEGEEVRAWTTAQGLPFNVVISLAVSPESGDLWVGTMGGLARVSAGRVDAFTQLSSGLANDVVYGLTVKGSEVWVATAAGLSNYNVRSQKWDIYDTENTLMHEPWIYALSSDAERVYAGIWGGGVLVYEPDGTFRDHRDPDGEMEVDLFRDDGLVHDVVSAVSVSGKHLWVGTYFGVSRYDGRRWRSWNSTDSGLAGDFINFVHARDGAVWIATDQGLSRFDMNTWHTWRLDDQGRHELRITGPDGKHQSRIMPTGLASNTIYGIAIGANGDLWVATAQGLCHGVPTTHPASAKGRSAKGLKP